jgi:hypothetical protein
MKTIAAIQSEQRLADAKAAALQLTKAERGRLFCRLHETLEREDPDALSIPLQRVRGDVLREVIAWLRKDPAWRGRVRAAEEIERRWEADLKA